MPSTTSPLSIAKFLSSSRRNATFLCDNLYMFYICFIAHAWNIHSSKKFFKLLMTSPCQYRTAPLLTSNILSSIGSLQKLSVKPHIRQKIGFLDRDAFCFDYYKISKTTFADPMSGQSLQFSKNMPKIDDTSSTNFCRTQTICINVLINMQSNIFYFVIRIIITYVFYFHARIHRHSTMCIY